MTRMKPAMSQAREMSMEPRRADSCAAYATSKAKSARADGQHQRLEHIARGPVLHEGRDARVLRFGPGRERQRALLLEPGALAEADRADPLAHHEIVLEPPAAVLAGAHLAREPVLVGGQIHGGVLLPGGIEKLRDELGVDRFRLDREDRERDPRAGRAGIDARHLSGERVAR